jgi:hypothetical protein
MSDSVPSPPGYMAGQSAIGSSILMSSFLMCVLLVTPFQMNESISLVRMGSFYSSRLLFSLLCHWLVGRAGRRGSLDVVRLLGAIFFVRGSRQRRRE